MIIVKDMTALKNMQKIVYTNDIHYTIISLILKDYVEANTFIQFVKNLSMIIAF